MIDDKLSWQDHIDFVYNKVVRFASIFRRDASICIARISYTATCLGGCLLQPVLYQNDKTYLKTFSTVW